MVGLLVGFCSGWDGCLVQTAVMAKPGVQATNSDLRPLRRDRRQRERDDQWKRVMLELRLMLGAKASLFHLRSSLR